MNMDEKLRAALISLIDSRIEVQTLPAIVTKVDADKGTCDVKFLDSDLADHYDVGLTAGEGTVAGLLIIPEVNSGVLVSVVNNDTQRAFVSAFSNIKEIRLRGDSLGGLIKINELKAQLDLNTQRIDTALDILKNQVQNCALHPNPEWAATITPVINALKKEDYTNIENTKVKHA